MLGIIGYGKMGSAIAKFALKKLPKIYVRDLKKLKKLPKGVKQTSLYELLKNSKVVLLAVKPQDMKDLLFDIDEILGYGERKKKLFITVAAGLRIKFYEDYLGKDVRLIRVMPNICIRVGHCTGCYMFNKNVKKKDIFIFEKIFGKNLIRVKNEELFDVVTALSASSPAFIAKFMKAFSDFAVKNKLSKREAEKLIIEATLGTALLLKEEKISFGELIESVASKRGTTAAGLEEWKKYKLDILLNKILLKTLKRAKQLAKGK